MLQITDMLKDGTKYLSGTQEAVLRNTDAAKKFAQIIRTSLGPNGMNKMVINHLEKLFVTSDAATIMKELDVVHPAAKMLVMAAQQQEQEIGDGTNFVAILGGEFLHQAEELLQVGLHTSEIISGYEKAGKKALEILEELAVHKVEDLRNSQQVSLVLKTAIGSHLYGYHELLAPKIADACIKVCPKVTSNFNVDNVRVAKIVGQGVSDTEVVKGFVLTRGAEGTIKHVKAAKIGVFASGIDLGKTETKGILKITNADQLLNFSKGEEKQMEDIIKSIADQGVNVVVSGGNIADMALHFLERYKIMAIKAPSKFQLRRICKAVRATPIVKIGAPTQEELGHCEEVTVEEIGSTQVTIFRQDKEESAVATLVVRGSTDNIMDDVERAVDDGVNVYKSMCKDNRFVAGAGAAEIEIARRLLSFAESTPGLEQYAIRKYAESFEVVARTLAETSGHNATEVISNLYAAHTKGTTNGGLDIETGKVIDAEKEGILDLLITKQSAIRLATATAATILRVDQIIVAKPAGGPKPPKQGPMDADD
jgi:T-complex protein 1 subunit theta